SLIRCVPFGFPTVSGLSILVWQGAKSFELWTGKEAPVEQMKRAVTGH
ncbi:MAG TPA: hypothetical protein GX524_02490, partial [Firmicutes bacterium]|nr:hypothetical protein [Bacillota bacterium]